MRILAVDPHINKAYAIALMSTTGQLFTLQYATLKEVAVNIRLADKVYIEDQYFGQNNSTLRQLAQSAGAIMGICDLYGTEYEMVHPKTWQARAGINLKRNGRKISEWDRYKHDLYIAKATELIGNWGVLKNSDDLAVAVIMACTMGEIK